MSVSFGIRAQDLGTMMLKALETRLESGKSAHSVMREEQCKLQEEAEKSRNDNN